MAHVTATFESRPEAEAVLARLETAGVREEQVSLIATEESLGNKFRIEERSRADEGVAAGATFGGVVGALLGSVLAAGTIAVPGLNLVVVGSLASGLAGLGAGAAAGGLAGALIGAGMSEHEARLYEGEIKSGNILLAVVPDSDSQKERVEDILRNSEAHDITG
jgi:hypothetical protein